MQWRALLALVAGAPSVHALLRFGCSQLVIERFDPLLNPSVVSPHLHQIIGGNAFNITMERNNNLFDLSTCTTCRFKEDTSNYWTAVLYYKHPNGSFHRVPQMANQFVGSTNGGMTVYYIQPYDNQKVTAPSKGFRMIVGDAMMRSMNQSNADAKAITFRCFGANFGDNNGAPGMGSDTHNLPNKKCEGGIRANIYFPMCWDGKTLDPPDHKSHVAFPTGDPGSGGMFGWGGNCPSTHPVRLPQLFTETVWDTRQFNSMPWPASGQPFVFSMGDPDGYGHHADYVFGWKDDSLQRAMDKCTDISGGNCNQLTQLTDAEINACSQASRVTETVDGWLNALPGCNPVQSGPGRATAQDGCGATTAYTPGGPAGPASPPAGGSPAVSPGGGTGSTGGGTVTPPFTGGTPPATGGGAAPPATGGATVAHYGQCGGNGYTGSTTCASPYTCKKQNDYYSQCV